MEITMNDKDTLTILRQCCDMLCDDQHGQPLDIERPGKQDMVLVSAATYSGMLQRIYDLEQALQTDEEREREEEELLRALVDASNSGRLH